MWLVIGRAAAQLVIRNPNNVIRTMFIRFTDPLYNAVKKIFPFSRVSEDKKLTTWGALDGFVPVILVLGIYIVLRPLIRIIVSVIIVNFK